MATHASSPRAKAEHYRTLAALMSDETAHRVLLDMAREYEEAAAREPGREPAEPFRPALRGFS